MSSLNYDLTHLLYWLYEYKPNESEIRNLQKIIIYYKTPQQIYRFAKFFSKYNECSIEKLEDALLESNNATYISLFGETIKGSNPNKIKHKLIELRSYETLARFAMFLPKKDCLEIQDLILKSNSYKAAYILLKYSKYASTKKIAPFLLKSNRPRYIFEISKKTTNKKLLKEIEDKIIISNSFVYLKMFAKKIKTANLDRIQDVIINNCDIKHMEQFLSSIPEAEKIKQVLLFA